MHVLCDKYGETWRRKFADRCHSGSALWNREEHAQAKVSEQMCAVAKKPKFVLNIGDNFQWTGITDANQQEMFKKHFESVYKCLWSEDRSVPFLSTLGPVDYGDTVCEQHFGGHSSIDAQINYDNEKDW